MRKMKEATTVLMTWATALAVVMLFASPALAHHKDGHATPPGQETEDGFRGASDHDGDADSDESTTYTEDTDTNDGNTPDDVADEGDNAHPSGKDRSVENDSEANPNQGKAESDPDDDGRGPDRSNGGPDRPNGSGGADLADQDGNNGCGNDDDFEDDNEGWCGRKPAGDVLGDVIGGDEDTVLPEDQTVPGEDTPDVIVDESNPADTVLGDLLTRPAVGADTLEAGPEVQAAVLPFTGVSVAGLTLVALALVVAGGLLMRTRKHA